MLNSRFSPWPSFTEEEAQAVQRVLLSNRVNYWTGEEGRRFEEEFAAFSDSQYAIALANGTVALELALRAGGIGPGDDVVVTPRTFIASASAIVTVGARPVFADVDTDSQNITVETIRAALTERTKAVICVHLAGWPCDMPTIMALAEQEKLFVIEDCAQAHGARIAGRSVGSFGHVGAWSFCQDKIMSTGGEGGMVTTNDRERWSRMWSFKDHGKSWEAVYEREHPPGFRWLHESFGTNFRMTEMQSVIGRIQLARMPAWTARRQHNAQIITDVARRYPCVRAPQPADAFEHACYKGYLFVEPAHLKPDWSRDRILEALVDEGVPAMSGSCSEVYREKAFDEGNLRPKDRLPVAAELGDTSLMFPVHPTLTDDEMQTIASGLERVLARASR